MACVPPLASTLTRWTDEIAEDIQAQLSERINESMVCDPGWQIHQYRQQGKQCLFCEGGFSAVTETETRLQDRLDISNSLQVHSLPLSPRRDHLLAGKQTQGSLVMIPHYGGLCNYFIMYYNVIIREMMYTINVMHVNHPQTTLFPNFTPSLWKNCFPGNPTLMLERLGIAATNISQIFLSLGPRMETKPLESNGA